MKVTDYILIKALSGGGGSPSAEDYDPSKSYKPGEYCIYDDELYICTKSTTGPWDEDCWMKASSTGEIVEELAKTQDMIAPEFDSTLSYKAGDYVIYEDDLYRFKNNHTGSWTGTDVVKVSMAEAIELVEERLGIHINDMSIHVTPEEKAIWNERLAVSCESETLIFQNNL